MTRKTVAVCIDADVLAAADRIAALAHTSRSYVCEEALKLLIARFDAEYPRWLAAQQAPAPPQRSRRQLTRPSIMP